MSTSRRPRRASLRGVGDRVLQVLTAARLRRPLLSVVVPVYNVEAYLEECLESILAQTVRDLEVVIVDDGSTDASGTIARRYARRSPLVRILRQENSGLGAARNAGAAAARGHLLAFVDSDDTIPPDAYAVMVGSLQRTGSDMAIGKVMRDRNGQRSSMLLMRRNHERERLGVSVEEMPEILADVFAWNKVFRRSFWDAHELRFPPRVRYEDQVALTEAILAAERIDVLRETVYFWRIRDDGTSITQRRNELADLEDRLLTKQLCSDMVHAFGSDAVEQVWWRTVLPIDMPAYFRAVPGSTEEYWVTLRDGMRAIWSRSPVPFVANELAVQQRLMGWLVENDRRDQLERLVAHLDANPSRRAVEVRGDRVVAVLPGLDEPDAGIPADLFELADHELRWEARLSTAAWERGRLHLEGFALIRNVPTGDLHTELTLELVGGPSALTVPLTPTRCAGVSDWAVRAGQDHDASGLVAEVDLAALGVSPDGGAVTRYRFHLQRTVEGIERSGPFTAWAPGVPSRRWRPAGDELEARLVVVEREPVLEVRRRAG